MLTFGSLQGAFRRLDAMVPPVSSGPKDPKSDPADAETLLWAVRAASRVVPHATCLTQAMGGHVMFRRRGLSAEIHVGVSRASTGAFEAHAWLVQNGQIILGDLPDLDRYLRIPTPWTGAS